MPNLRGLKCWFWNKIPNIERAISWSNIDQFSKLRIFLKSEICVLLKSYQNINPRWFGCREIAKNKVSKVLVDTLYETPVAKLGTAQPRLVSSWNTMWHSLPEWWSFNILKLFQKLKTCLKVDNIVVHSWVEYHSVTE